MMIIESIVLLPFPPLRNNEEVWRTISIDQQNRIIHLFTHIVYCTISGKCDMLCSSSLFYFVRKSNILHRSPTDREALIIIFRLPHNPLQTKYLSYLVLLIFAVTDPSSSLRRRLEEKLIYLSHLSYSFRRGTTTEMFISDISNPCI